MPRKPTSPSGIMARGLRRATLRAISRTHVLSLAHHALAYARGWCADSRNARVRLAAENERLESALAMLREEIRIKDARMLQIAPLKRPHYPPPERLAILALQAARGWNLAQTAARPRTLLTRSERGSAFVGVRALLIINDAMRHGWGTEGRAARRARTRGCMVRATASKAMRSVVGGRQQLG